MRRFFVLGCFIFIGVLGWRLGERLSPDALGMALGVLFGILAGIPTALMVLASARRRAEEENADEDSHGRGRNTAYPADYRAMPHQPPVIILAGNGAPLPYGQQNYATTNPYAGMDGQGRPALPGPTANPGPRQYKVVGEKEEWLDEFS